MDMRKAFDMVNHGILLCKLSDAGIRGTVILWFQSYIDGRRQKVKINEQLSDQRKIACGVPQGSLLAAELFLVYINDLCKGCFNGNVSSYADDIALAYEADSEANLI